MTRFLSRYWFPAALVILLLMALPGIVLLAIHLLGQEAAVSAWLQENWKISYHLSVPVWAGIVLLLVPLLLLLLYFLRLKRKPLQVPSTFLWKKSIEDLHVNSLFQWLRENVLLLLQLLTLLALIYAVMAFQFHGKSSEGQHYIVMLDNSASMSATDVTPSRLHEAKRLALQEIDSHADDDVGMVIVFNSSAEILQSYTSDKGLLRAAVEKIQQTQRLTRIDDALSLADSLANPHSTTDDAVVRPEGVEPGKERTYVPAEGIPTTLHVFTDGRFPDVPDFALGNLQARYHSIGSEKVENVGLVAFSATRSQKDPNAVQVLAGVRNYLPREASVRVRLEVRINGELQKIYEEPPDGPLVLPARMAAGDAGEPGRVSARSPLDAPGEGFVTFQVSNLDDRAGAVLHASLVDHRDHLALDDEAWLVVGVVRKARVLVVGPSNPALHAFFDQPSAAKLATVAYLAPSDLKDDAKYRKPAREGAYDLIIFDRCAPETETELPLANTFFIDSVPPPWKRAEMKPLQNPDIKGRLKDNPLLRYLSSVHTIGLTEAFRFDLKDPRVPPRTPRLIETDRETAVLFTLARQSFTDLVMTFPILNSEGKWTTTWPLHLGFPLFLTNVVTVLGNVEDGVDEEIKRPGDAKVLRPDRAMRSIEVEGPDGTSETLTRTLRTDFVYGPLPRVGVYQVKWDGQVQRSFAVNLLDSAESDLTPRPSIDIGDERIAAGEVKSTPRDVWKWVALAALLLLLLEWYIYNRRVYI
jgi:hypothetical protein